MFELKRQEKIREELRLGDQVLLIEIIPEAIALEYQKAGQQLMRARDAIRAAKNRSGGMVTEAETKALGEAIVALLTILMGKENTDKLVAFYEENYMELLLMIFPFITDVIQPQIESTIAALLERTKGVYKTGKQAKKWGPFRRQ